MYIFKCNIMGYQAKCSLVFKRKIAILLGSLPGYSDS